MLRPEGSCSGNACKDALAAKCEARPRVGQVRLLLDDPLSFIKKRRRKKSAARRQLAHGAAMGGHTIARKCPLSLPQTSIQAFVFI